MLHTRVSEMEQAADVERQSLEQSMGQRLEEAMQNLTALKQQNKELTKELKSSLEALELHDRATKVRRLIVISTPPCFGLFYPLFKLVQNLKFMYPTNFICVILIPCVILK